MMFGCLTVRDNSPIDVGFCRHGTDPNFQLLETRVLEQAILRKALEKAIFRKILRVKGVQHKNQWIKYWI